MSRFTVKNVTFVGRPGAVDEARRSDDPSRIDTESSTATEAKGSAEDLFFNCLSCSGVANQPQKMLSSRAAARRWYEEYCKEKPSKQLPLLDTPVDNAPMPLG